MKLSSLRIIGLSIAVLAVGFAVGLFVPQHGIRGAIMELAEISSLDHGHEDEHMDDAHDDHEEEHAHVELSKTAQKSLGLKRIALTPTSYVAHTSLPAVVVERPAISDLHVVTQYEGIVEEILAVPGQAVREGDALFKIRLTGDSLASAQTAFLDAVQQLDIQDQEIARLEKAAEGGGLARKELLQRQYERRRIAAKQETRHQELLIRGLTAKQIAEIVESRQLIRSVEIRVPTGLVEFPGQSSEDFDPWQFSIEELLVTPGLLVKSGEPLCNLAYHASLYLEGLAFERDVPAVTELLVKQTKLNAELGEDRQPINLEDLQIVHLANHVHSETQAYQFYLELDNELVQENITRDGRRFRSWKYKPGQRGHILLPQKTYKGIFRVPAEAVVNDGLEYTVFRKETGDDHDHDDHGDEPQEEMDAFEPVQVHLLHKDRRFAVLATDGELKAGNVIAANSAYQLFLATKSGEGGGHHHDHDH